MGSWLNDHDSRHAHIQQKPFENLVMTERPMILKFGMQFGDSGPAMFIQSDLWLTLTYFKSGQIGLLMQLYGGKGKTVDFFKLL